MIIISSLLGTLFLSGSLSFGLETGLLLLLTTESNFLLETGELAIDFLDEFGCEMQILCVGEEGLHVAHLSDYGV